MIGALMCGHQGRRFLEMKCATEVSSEIQQCRVERLWSRHIRICPSSKWASLMTENSGHYRVHFLFLFLSLSLSRELQLFSMLLRFTSHTFNKKLSIYRILNWSYKPFKVHFSNLITPIHLTPTKLLDTHTHIFRLLRRALLVTYSVLLIQPRCKKKIYEYDHKETNTWLCIYLYIYIYITFN